MIAGAQRRAARLYPTSTAFQGAYVKGARAALAGRPSSSCPYRRDARNTWRNAWRVAWMRGHQSVTLDQADEG